MTQTGAAQKITDGIADALGGLGAHALLLGLVLLAFALGQPISNMATALILIPIAVSAAGSWSCRRSPF